MKFSEQWLREWVNPAINSKELVEQITMAGIEVDSVDSVAEEQLRGVVIGFIMSCKRHPNSDKLYINKVNIGNGKLLNIICGAPNCRPDLRVAVATIGALLSSDFQIKKTKIRGKFSEGMLCSFSELGINTNNINNNEIIELPENAPIGCDIREYLQLYDTIININVKSNRSDCLSLYGIARDIAILNCITLNQPVTFVIPPKINYKLPISVIASQECPRYLNRVVKNIDNSIPTPLWMKEKLRRCGLCSINAVVDIMNFVLLEFGQPIHALDLSSIDNGIVVRMAEDGEKLKLIDDREITLKKDTLVTASFSKKVLSIAGICGGKESSIMLGTQDVVLECAFFNPLVIRGRARRYGLHTHASHRYERGIDPTLQYHCIERATQLLIDICGGQPGEIINVTSAPALPTPVTIHLRRTKLNRLLGHIIDSREVHNILLRLGYKVIQVIDGWQALVPSWRFDIEIEEDLIQDISRIYGYNSIMNIPIRANLVVSEEHRETELPLSRVKMLLVDRGYQEAITYSFVDQKVQSLLHKDEEFLSLLSPISIDMSVMRLSLWTGLLKAVLYNKNRQHQHIRLFESGLCFIPDNTADLGIRQELVLSGVIAGQCTNNRYWDHQLHHSIDFFDAKGDLEAILELTGKLDSFKFKPYNHTAMHQGQSAAIYIKDEIIGFIGVINPTLSAKFDLNIWTLVFELIWNKISTCKVPKATDIPRFPVNRRDIAIIVAEDVNAGDIINELKKINVNNEIIQSHLFDVYRGQGIAQGYKSLAISLLLQNTTRAMKDKEINETVNKCVSALKRKFHISLRN